jgi:hypothetical protein
VCRQDGYQQQKTSTNCQKINPVSPIQGAPFNRCRKCRKIIRMRCRRLFQKQTPSSPRPTMSNPICHSKHAYPVDTGWCFGGMILRMSDYPRTLLEFQHLFPDETADGLRQPSGPYKESVRRTCRAISTSLCSDSTGDYGRCWLRNQTRLC